MIKILGYNYVVLENELLRQFGASGNMDSDKLIIGLDPTLNNNTSTVSTLLHEIIEALNYHLSIGLEEQQIMQLEAGLYQVLTDNGIGLSPLLALIDKGEK